MKLRAIFRKLHHVIPIEKVHNSVDDLFLFGRVPAAARRPCSGVVCSAFTPPQFFCSRANEISAFPKTPTASVFFRIYSAPCFTSAKKTACGVTASPTRASKLQYIFTAIFPSPKNCVIFCLRKKSRPSFFKKTYVHKKFYQFPAYCNVTSPAVSFK